MCNLGLHITFEIAYIETKPSPSAVSRRRWEIWERQSATRKQMQSDNSSDPQSIQSILLKNNAHPLFKNG